MWHPGTAAHGWLTKDGQANRMTPRCKFVCRVFQAGPPAGSAEFGYF